MDLTIIMLLTGMWLIFFLLSVLPLLRSFWQAASSALSMGLAAIIGVLLFNVEVVVGSKPLLYKTLDVINSSFTNVTYTYSSTTVYTTSVIPDTWMISFLFFGLAVISLLRLVEKISYLMFESAEPRNLERTD